MSHLLVRKAFSLLELLIGKVAHNCKLFGTTKQGFNTREATTGYHVLLVRPAQLTAGLSVGFWFTAATGMEYKGKAAQAHSNYRTCGVSNAHPPVTSRRNNDVSRNGVCINKKLEDQLP